MRGRWVQLLKGNMRGPRGDETILHPPCPCQCPGCDILVLQNVLIGINRIKGILNFSVLVFATACECIIISI